MAAMDIYPGTSERRYCPANRRRTQEKFEAARMLGLLGNG